MCPACGRGRLRSLGAPWVRPGPLAYAADAVVRCLTCDLLFFVPVGDAPELVAHYESLVGPRWSGARGRPDWDLARAAVVARVSGGRILDVGCWTGEFLATFGAGFEKHGVEPSRWAQGHAARAGVVVVGARAAHVDRAAPYDVVTMTDVIEHSARPLDELLAARRLLAPGGILVVTTGDSRALPWRLMPRDHWYYYPEHRCFFSLRWFRWAAAQAGLRVLEHRRFSHFPAGATGAGADLGKAAVFRALGGPRSAVYRGVVRSEGRERRPDTRRWPDHLLVVLGPGIEGP